MVYAIHNKFFFLPVAMIVHYSIERSDSGFYIHEE